MQIYIGQNQNKDKMQCVECLNLHNLKAALFLSKFIKKMGTAISAAYSSYCDLNCYIF